ncbi:chemotaxis response regulator protein-glutamate methylesterase [Sphingosinicella ginsenosidimutans]
MTAQGAIVRRPTPSGEPPIRLMIVDDSSVARAVISRMVGADPEFEVVAMAGSAIEALDALKTVSVDIVLLDVEMPGGSGLEALPHIIRAGAGARVLVVSSMAEDGAEVAVRALAQGAADTLPKPGANAFSGRFSEVLADKIRRIGRANREPAAAEAVETRPLKLRDMPAAPLRCVALGASTGGLHALLEFLRALPEPIGAPILVTQHLPATFMPYFARQLEAASGRIARVAEDGETPQADFILVAPGDSHLCVQRAGALVQVKLEKGKAPSGCLPSVDPMLASVADAYGESGLGIMMSGMGRDGLIGSRRMVERGGAMLAQDQQTASIWGMPRAVAEAGLASAVLPPQQLARRVAMRAEAASWR